MSSQPMTERGVSCLCSFIKLTECELYLNVVIVVCKCFKNVVLSLSVFTCHLFILLGFY